MRIPNDKPVFTDPLRTRDKAATVESPARPAQGAGVTRAGDAAIPSASLDQALQDTDTATRAFESTIAARLAEVKDQLRSGTYGIDYERLASSLLEDGFGS
jgi:anti-sigma28 factor (negative regulator of flagellin synthesis)